MAVPPPPPANTSPPLGSKQHGGSGDEAQVTSLLGNQCPKYIKWVVFITKAEPTGN